MEDASTLQKMKAERKNEMTKTEIENKIYDLEKSIKRYENMIKANENEIKKLEAEKERPTFERVEEGKKYYTVTAVSYDGIFVKEYIEEHMRLDESNFENNNYFLTKERAEEVADKIKFLLKLERLHDIYCPDYKLDWEDEKRECYWYVKFDSRTKTYKAVWGYHESSTTAYFDSEETAERVCEILNKELEK